MKKIHFHVYILLCENNTFYTGYTRDMEKRWHAHLNGTARCRYTRSFKPVMIAQYWRIFGNRSLAMRIEAKIKTLSHAEKVILIKNPTMLQNDYPLQCVQAIDVTVPNPLSNMSGVRKIK